MVEVSREAMKVSRRVLAEMRVWRVGQVVGGVVVEGGVYAYLVMPDSENSAASCDGVALSELTRRTVTTSLGLLSIQSLTSDSQSLSRPASSRSQSVWQRCHAPLL